MLLSDECSIKKNLISEEILEDKFKCPITVKATDRKLRCLHSYGEILT